MGAQTQVWLVHPDLPDQPIRVGEGAVPIHERSGWRPARPEFLPERAGQPAAPPSTGTVQAFNPALGATIDVLPSAMDHLRASGWLLLSEWAENQATAARQAAARAKDEAPGDDGRPGRARTAAKAAASDQEKQ